MNLYLDPDAAVARIVKSVGKKHTPSDLDCDRLRAALQQSLARHVGDQPRQKKKIKGHRKEAKAIAYHADMLVRLLNQAPAVTDMVTRYRHIDAPSPPLIDNLVKDLRVLTVVAENAAVEIRPLDDSARKRWERRWEVVAENAAAEPQPLDDSAKKRWVRDLGKVFCKYFKRKPGASISASGKATGPFVRFVVATAEEAGVEKMAPATVADYIKGYGVKRSPKA